MYASGGHPKPQDCQDVGGGYPKPHRNHSEEQSKEQITSLGRTELCVSCNEKADDNTFECQWCSHWEHKVCAKISFVAGFNLSQHNVFCTPHASRVPQTLTIVDRFQVFENNIVSVVKKSIASQFITSFESAQLDNAYHKLQKSVDKIYTKINICLNSQQTSSL